MGDPIASAACSLATSVGVAENALSQLSRAWRADDAAAIDCFSPDDASAIRTLDVELSTCTATASGIAGRVIATDEKARAVVATWAAAAARRRDLVLAPLLTTLQHTEDSRARVEMAARTRVRYGPIRDALACLALTGRSAWIADPEHSAVRARAELLFWEAGSTALSVPELGPWLFSHSPVLGHLVLDAAAGSLRARAVAARAITIAADGVRAPELPRHLQSGTERVLRRLASHPSPSVWIPAARGIGRLAARLHAVRRLLWEWLDSENAGERRRAMTALASMPEGESLRIDARLEQVVADERDPWIAAALGPAIPYLACERRQAWEQVAARLEQAPPGPEVTWSVAQGLAALARRESLGRLEERVLRGARERALGARPRSATEAQLWQSIRSDSDFLDGLEPDPSDPDRLLQRQVTAALRVGARQVAERARFTARSLLSSFETALPTAASTSAIERRAASCLTLESCARAASLALWEPILACARLPLGGLADEVREARASMVRALVPRMAVAEPEHAFRRAALRVLSCAVEDSVPDVLGAIESAAWLVGEGKQAGRFRKPLADVLWGVVDATRLSAFASDPMLYPRFAAWWALSSAVGTTLLEHLGRSEAAARAGQSNVFEAVDSIRSALLVTAPGAVEGAWAVAVLRQLGELRASETALAEGLAELASALDAAGESRTSLTEASLEAALEALVHSAARMRALLADPRQALRMIGEWELPAQHEGPGVGGLARAARRATSFDAGEYAERWSSGLGPLLGPLVAKALTALLEAHVGQELTSDSVSRRHIGGYRLVKLLGEGEMGAVWLVCEQRIERHFVMKLPAVAFSRCTAKERRRLEHAVALESEALRTIHHPNVANLIDYGWDGDTPFLVLEYLAGIDLEEYIGAGLLSRAECKPVVADICAGLRALHSRGLVHRDLKPGNVFMRLDLGPPGTAFEPRKHRYQGHTPLLGAVIIDFGIVATQRTSVRSRERVVAGTLGFIAPEQARGSPLVDDRADVYGLAATVYAALTGNAFFETDALTGSAWLEAHATNPPLDDDARVHGLPDDLVALLRAATRLEPSRRPDVASFARRFARLSTLPP